MKGGLPQAYNISRLPVTFAKYRAAKKLHGNGSELERSRYQMLMNVLDSSRRLT